MTAAQALEDPWIKGAGVAAAPGKKPPNLRLSGTQLASRFTRFVGLSRLKKTALNVLAHHLTEKEISELSKIWCKLDVDKSGVITVKQLYSSLRDNGHHATEAEILTFMDGLDLNDDHVFLESGVRRRDLRGGTDAPLLSSPGGLSLIHI